MISLLATLACLSAFAQDETSPWDAPSGDTPEEVPVETAEMPVDPTEAPAEDAKAAKAAAKAEAKAQKAAEKAAKKGEDPNGPDQGPTGNTATMGAEPEVEPTSSLAGGVGMLPELGAETPVVVEQPTEVNPAEFGTDGPPAEPIDKRPAQEPAETSIYGWRYADGHAPTGVKVSQEFVVGPAGGTNGTTVEAHLALNDKWSFGFGVPFAAFRTPEDRTTGLGNFQFEGWRTGKRGSFGVQAHLGVGGKAYTWTNRPEDFWPGTGIDFAWQRQKTNGGLTLGYRLAAGLHGAQGYKPFPSVYLRLNGTGLADIAIGSRFGITGEASLQTWDTSPLELTGLFRAEIIEGLQARGGLVLPLGVWAGWTPSDQKAGLSETTIVLDVQLRL